MEQKTIWLLCSLMGIATLLVLTFLPYQEVNSQKELDALEDNQKSVAQGTIFRQSIHGENAFLILDNNLSIVTSRSPLLLQGKKIKVEGKKESYQGKSQIRALRITLLFND